MEVETVGLKLVDFSDGGMVLKAATCNLKCPSMKNNTVLIFLIILPRWFVGSWNKKNCERS